MSDAVPDRKLIRDHFEFQARGSEDTGSPFVAALCRLLAARLDDSTTFGRTILDLARPTPRTTRCPSASSAPSTPSSAPARSRPSPPPIHPPRSTPTPSGPRSPPPSPATTHALTAFLDSAPQTNEVARSGLILGGALHVAQRTRLPLEVFEIGSSAGLNLAFDEYRYDLGNGLAWGRPDAPVTIHCEWSGNLPPLDAPLSVVARAGCDRRPLDPANPADAERLMAYIWADQPHRLERTAAALRHAAAHEPQGRRASMPANGSRPASPGRRRPGVCRMLVHTIVWQYMPRETQDRITAALAKAAAAATPETPIAHFAMEPDDIDGSAPHDPDDLARRRARHPRPRPLPRPLGSVGLSAIHRHPPQNKKAGLAARSPTHLRVAVSSASPPTSAIDAVDQRVALLSHLLLQHGRGRPRPQGRRHAPALRQPPAARPARSCPRPPWSGARPASRARRWPPPSAGRLPRARRERCPRLPSPLRRASCA